MFRGATGDGHGGESGIQAGAGDEDAGITNEKVLYIVRLAMLVYHGGGGITPHAARAHGVSAVVQADAYRPRA